MNIAFKQTFVIKKGITFLKKFSENSVRKNHKEGGV